MNFRKDRGGLFSDYINSSCGGEYYLWVDFPTSRKMDFKFATDQAVSD